MLVSELALLTEESLAEMLKDQHQKRREVVKIIWDIDSEIVSIKEEIRRRHPEIC